jgi:hypothetical protein
MRLCPLLRPLPGEALLPLVRSLVAVRSVTQLPKLPAGLSAHDGLKRGLERFPAPVSAGLRLPC